MRDLDGQVSAPGTPSSTPSRICATTRPRHDGSAPAPAARLAGVTAPRQPAGRQRRDEHRERGFAMPAIERADRRQAPGRAACRAASASSIPPRTCAPKRDLHQRHGDQRERAPTTSGAGAARPHRAQPSSDRREERVDRGIQQQRHDDERDQQVQRSRSTPRARAATTTPAEPSLKARRAETRRASATGCAASRR